MSNVDSHIYIYSNEDDEDWQDRLSHAVNRLSNVILVFFSKNLPADITDNSVLVLDGNFDDDSSNDGEWSRILDEVKQRGLPQMLVIGFSSSTERMQHRRINENPGKDVFKVAGIIKEHFKQ